MKARYSLCVTIQTPLVRFQVDLGEIYNKYGEVPEPLLIDMLAEGKDYSYAPGGVTRLLPSLFRSLEKRNNQEAALDITESPWTRNGYLREFYTS